MTTYYVSKSGSGDFRTIGAAMKAVKAGDEVVVRSGTYKESVRINQDGNPGDYITLRSEEPGGAKIVAPGGYGIHIAGNYVKVKGFEVSGSSGGGIVGHKVHHVEVSNNESHHNRTHGITFTRSDFVTVEGNTTYHNASAGYYSGISITRPDSVGGGNDGGGFRIIVRNNVSHHNMTKSGPHTDGNGIIIDDFNYTKVPGTGYKFATLVQNNLVYENGGRGIQVAWSNNVTVRDNIAWHNNQDLKNDGMWRGELSNLGSSHTNWVGNIAITDPNKKANNAIANVAFGNDTNKDVQWHNNLTYSGKAGDDAVMTNNGNSKPPANGNRLGVKPEFNKLPIDLGGNRGDDGPNPGPNPGPDGDAWKTLFGDGGRDNLRGSAGDDKLFGQGGADRLSGKDGSDLLRGGKSKDALVGGGDDDVFAFRSAAEAGQGRQRDTIRDFSRSEGDEIDLRGIDANVKMGGNQDFAYIGAKGFSGKAGQLQYKNGIVSGDVNGDRDADFQIDIAHNPGLNAGDFLL